MGRSSSLSFRRALSGAVAMACVMLALAGFNPALAQTRSVRGTAPATASYLGVGVQQIDQERARQLQFPASAGVEVTRLQAGSPAERAGLRIGDVITAYNGEPVQGIDQFARMVRETRAGRDVVIEVFRNGGIEKLTAKLGSVPDLNGGSAAQAPPPMPDVPHSLMTWRSPVLGVEAESLDGQLAAYFGVTLGVLVRSVALGSPAARAGLKAGDVIVKIDSMAVATPGEITGALRGVADDVVPVAVMRDHKLTNVTVTLDRIAP